MVDPYRRHTAKCEPGKKFGRRWTKCDCPVWAFGYVGGAADEPRVWESLKTRNWEHAKDEINRRWYPERLRPVDPALRPSPKGPTIREAASAFLVARENENDQPRTLQNYATFLNTFVVYAKRELQLTNVGDLRLDHLQRFVAWRKKTTVKSHRTQNKEKGVLSMFCSFCEDNDWMLKDYAKRLPYAEQEAPKDWDGTEDLPRPYPPYTIEEVNVLVTGCDHFLGKRPTPNKIYKAKWTRAMMLLLLNTGYRVSNGVRFAKQSIRPDGTARVVQIKTKKPVSSDLKESTIQALYDIPPNPRYPTDEVSPYFFAYGGVKWASIETRCRYLFAKVGKHVGMHCCPHRLRNTFGMLMINDGKKMEDVSRLLGHASIATTQKYYMHWSKQVEDQILTVAKGIPDFGSMNPSKVIEFQKRVVA